MDMNKLLRDTDRIELQPVIYDMQKLCPNIILNKTPRANVQQAFILKAVASIHSDKNLPVLCVGIFDDTAAYSLINMGYSVIGIDPVIDYDLHTYRINNENIRYSTIFSTSVIEHVKNDDQFIHDICHLLSPGGTAIITCDFNDTYKNGDSLFINEERFYTTYDLSKRFPDILSQYNCKLIGTPDWSGTPDFTWCGLNYSFATFSFKKEGQ